MHPGGGIQVEGPPNLGLPIGFFSPSRFTPAEKFSFYIHPPVLRRVMDACHVVSRLVHRPCTQFTCLGTLQGVNTLVANKQFVPKFTVGP